MKPIQTKQSLSPSRQQFVELMQDVNFGKIDGITVRNGEPIFDPPPRLIREIKLSGENGPRPELHIGDFVLKDQVVKLFEHFDDLGNGTIGSIEVKQGLPFLMKVEETVQV